MTDRELLELAAMPGGIAGEYRAGLGICPPELSQLHKFWWNPLIDDGDALRLAVKLRLTVKIEDHEIEVFNWEDCLVSVGMFKGDDYEAATRRAIVYAACSC